MLLVDAGTVSRHLLIVWFYVFFLFLFLCIFWLVFFDGLFLFVFNLWLRFVFDFSLSLFFVWLLAWLPSSFFWSFFVIIDFFVSCYGCCWCIFVLWCTLSALSFSKKKNKKNIEKYYIIFFDFLLQHINSLL